MEKITRRAALSTLSAVPLALALPAIAVAADSNPWIEVHRLCGELGAALAKVKNRQFAARVMPDLDGQTGIFWFVGADETPAERLDRARGEFVAATKAAHPAVKSWRCHHWEGDPDPECHGMFLITPSGRV